MQTELKNLFFIAIDALEKKFEAFPLEDKEIYRRWMNQQFYLVQNSTRYLALSASKVSPSESKEFREWVGHLSEELDHDQLILHDLKKMGTPHSDRMAPITRALIYTQYQDIIENGPNALLGYALMLEGLSCKICGKLADRVESSHGKGTATYLRFHAKVDAEHFPEGLKKVAELSVEQAKIVANNLEVMFSLYSEQLNSFVDKSRVRLINYEYESPQVEGSVSNCV